jgi:outer membrane immunogenic protein
MKKFLMSCAAVAALALPGAANAADLAIRPVVPAPAPAVSWTGCYVGFHAGAGWGDKWWSDRWVQDNVSYATSGWVTGAQLGCDYQTGPFVIGAEGSWSWTNLEGNGAPANLLVFGSPAQFRSKIDSLTTAGGRVGLVADKSLIYVKVAAVWAEESHTLTPSAIVVPAAVFPQTISDTRFGIGLGAGIEYMIAPVLTAKLEYNYDDFGSKTFFFNTIPGQVDVDNRQRLHLLKLGVNYKFW